MTVSTSLIQDARAHHQAGRRAEAEEICRRLLEADPQCAPALHLLGIMAQSQNRQFVAAKLLRMAIAADPQVADYHNTLGTVLADLRDFEPAFVSFRQAMRLRMDYTEAGRNLAAALAKVGRLGDSARVLRTLLERNDKSSDLLQDLAVVCNEQIDAAGLLDAREALCRARAADAIDANRLLYALHYDDRQAPAGIFREHLGWAARHAEPLRAAFRPHASVRDADRRLRIGYVSAGFRTHPVARFQEAAIRHHDRSQVEVFCYASVAKPDAVTARLQSLADHWRDVRPLSDEALAEQIRADGIDVLVDLDGHDAGNRLLCFARRPAPVQVTANGYINTTGMAAMDYRLTDQWHDPAGMTEHLHTEELWRLPGGVWCYTPDDATRDAVDGFECGTVSSATGDAGVAPTSAGMAPMSDADAFTVIEQRATQASPLQFGCLNKLIKASPTCCRLWAKVLAAVPGSRLMLVLAGHENTRPDVLDRLAELGLPRDRLDLVTKGPLETYLDRFRRIDVHLDPLPFNGITTTCDGLWMGCPTVTLAGNTFASRAGVSLLNMVGLPELIARTEEQYVQIAADLATDRPRLAELRRTLRQRMLASPLCDGVGFARKLEAAYRAMWRRWCVASSETG